MSSEERRNNKIKAHIFQYPRVIKLQFQIN
jgi:hypothetical protein